MYYEEHRPRPKGTPEGNYYSSLPAVVALQRGLRASFLGRGALAKVWDGAPAGQGELRSAPGGFRACLTHSSSVTVQQRRELDNEI